MPINSAKICQYMLGAKDIVAQGARVCKYVSRQQKEEPILRGLISQDFIFLKRGMLGTLIIGPNTCQLELCAKC